VYKRQIKWRCTKFKGFTQDGAARSLWGIETFESGNIVITEGEIDCLSFREAGYTSENGWTVVSVPNGAPSSVSKNDNSKKYSYLWDAKDALGKAEKIVIASDNDKPGDSLAEEITRRIGRHKCWRIKYPDGSKDANEVLVKHGKEKIKEMMDSAIPWPIAGLRSVLEYEGHVLKYHNEGPVVGTGTGVKPVDELFNACPGSFVVVTGIPGSGKSTWLSWLMIKLANRDNQKFAVWSAEMPATMLVSNLCATYKGKAFRGSGGMSPEEVKESVSWIDEHMVIIETNDTDIDTICEGAIASILRKGITGLVIDPYNMITRSGGHSEEASLTNIRYILKKLKQLALEYSITVYLIAHPRKMLQEVGRPCIPTGYEVSGSADFYNIADIGITIAKVEDGKSLMVNWKSRFPHYGRNGSNMLNFDLSTGSYADPMSGTQGNLNIGMTMGDLADRVDQEI
jgi:twinkle protein